MWKIYISLLQAYLFTNWKYLNYMYIYNYQSIPVGLLHLLIKYNWLQHNKTTGKTSVNFLNKPIVSSLYKHIYGLIISFHLLSFIDPFWYITIGCGNCQ
jgi:hypothetical protein